MRTGTESKKNRDKIINPVLMSSTVSLLTNVHHKLTIKDFMLLETERETMNELQINLETYMLFEHLFKLKLNHTESSNVSYLDVLDAKSDCKDTLLPIAL